ncbi:MAG TPA: DUF2079 domain-containing protein, partial [Polyangia bacterium]
KAAIVALCYLLYPPLHGSNLYDFHYIPLGPFFLWFCLYALEARRNWLAVVFVALTLSVREDVSVALVIVGGYLVLSGERPKAGLIVAAVGAAFFVLIKMIIMPRMIGEASFVYIYKNLLPSGEGGFGGVLKTVIGNPVFTLHSLLERDKLMYFLQVATPLAFLSFRRPLDALFCLPGFMFTLLSTGYTPVYQISFQYTAHWTMYVFLAVVLNLAAVARRRPDIGDPRVGAAKQTAWIVAMVTSTIIVSHQYGALLQQNTVRGGFGPYNFGRTDEDRARYRSLRELLAKVPPRAKIVGTETLVPHFSNRPDAYTMRMGVFDAEYLIFHLPVGGDEGKKLGEALRSGKYGVLEIKEPYALAKLGHSTAKNAEVQGRVSE